MAAVYYESHGATIIHADSEQYLADHLSQHAMPNLGQIVVTSPPYNMGLTPGGNGRGMYRPSESRKGGRFRAGYDEHDDAMPQAEYDEWQRRTLGLLWQVIPDDGAIYYNHRGRIEHGKLRLPLGLDFGGIPLRQMITWDRGTGIGVNRRHYCSVAEWIFLFAKPGFKLRDHSSSGAGDVWRLGMEHKKRGDFIAPFPVGLPAKVIQTTNARSVLDPFAGTGTTLVAAVQAGIKSIGIEKSERYCELMALRLGASLLKLTGGEFL